MNSLPAPPLTQVRRMLAPHVPALAWVGVASVVNAVAQSTRAWLMKPLTGAMLTHLPAAPTTAQAAQAAAARTPATAGEFLLIAVAMLGLSVVVAACTFTGEWIHKRTLVQILVDLRLRIATHLLRVPIARYASERVGDLLARLTTDVRASENAVRTVGVKIWEQGALVIGAMITAALVSPTLTVILLAPFVPLAVGFLFVMGRKVRHQAKRNLVAQADLTQAMQQVLSGMKVIKVFHTEEREKAAYAQRSLAQYERAQRVAHARARSRGGAEFLINLAVAGALGFGGLAVTHGWFDLDLPSFAAFSTVLFMIYTPIRGLNQMWSGHQESLPAIERTTAVLQWEPEPPDDVHAQPCPPLERGVHLERITFTYAGGDEPALADVTLDIPKGQVTAVVGESGAGKSTFLDLLLRLADPQAGTLRWDDVDLRRCTRASLRARIALVSQDPFLFHASVAHNLRYGRPDATDADLESATRAADVHDVIVGLPEGYDTIVGERGQRLSGGERQRLTIARALLRDPDLLLLDEATAALDSVSEARVLTALERLMAGRTTIWVAHRLTSVVRADQIVVLEAGGIAERGTHDELVAANGVYARLWREQSESPEADA